MIILGDKRTWTAAIASYQAWMKSQGWAAGTVAVKLKYLGRLRRTIPSTLGPFELSEDDLLEFLAYDGWAPETRKSARSAVRTFYKWAYDTRRIDDDVSARLPTVKVPDAPPRPTPDKALEDALDRSDSRTRLMLLLAARAGLRRAEIAALHTGNVEDGGLVVRGKGGRVRRVPIHPEVAEYLQALPDGYLFPGQDGGHLSPDRVGRVMSAALGPGWTAHTLRHRFATRGYQAGHDLFSLQEVLGHASPTTTRRYTRTTHDAAMRIVMAS